MSTTTHPEPLLTLDHVKAKRLKIVAGERALAQAERTVLEIAEAIKADQKEFQQMMVFVPKHLHEAVLADEPETDLFSKPPADESDTEEPEKESSSENDQPEPRTSAGRQFAIFLVDVLRKARRGLSHSELKAAVAESEHASRLDDQAKAYHRTIGKLIAKGQMKRHGTLLYAPSVLAIIELTDGLPEIDESGLGRENSSARIALEILKEAPEGLTGPELKVRVGAHPSAPKSVLGHGQYIYNILATLVGSGRVTKEGSHYMSAETARPRSSGASGTHASDPAR